LGHTVEVRRKTNNQFHRQYCLWAMQSVQMLSLCDYRKSMAERVIDANWNCSREQSMDVGGNTLTALLRFSNSRKSLRLLHRPPFKLYMQLANKQIQSLCLEIHDSLLVCKMQYLNRVSMCAHGFWGQNISKTVEDRGSGPKGHQ